MSISMIFLHSACISLRLNFRQQPHLLRSQESATFPSSQAKTNSARYGETYQFSTNNSVPFAFYDVVETWDFMEF